jgi:hypothetical protein
LGPARITILLGVTPVEISQAWNKNKMPDASNNVSNKFEKFLISDQVKFI